MPAQIDTGELYRSIGRLESKVDSLVQLLSEHVNKDEAAWGKVARLEKKLWWVNGVIATIVFFMTTSAATVLQKIGIFK